MKVLICAYSCLKDPDKRFGDGGEGFLGWNIVKQIAGFGQVWVLTEAGNKSAIKEGVRIESLANVNFCYVALPKIFQILGKIHGGVQFTAYLWQIKAYLVAKKLHKKIKFDVFHHVTYANDWMASFIGALLPIACVRGPGGGAHRVPQKFLLEYPPKERILDKLRSVGQWVFKHDPFFIIGQNKAKTILVCNRESFEALPEKWQKKARIFPVNGVSARDLSILSKPNSGNNIAFTILSAGKLLRIKGFDLAIRAFKVFCNNIPTAKLIIIGDGPESSNLKKITTELGIKDRVIFKNWIRREELFREITSCHVFLFPSLRDGGGQVVIEALAAGKPVVCFDIAGPGFHIDENCGIKIKPENPEQAVKNIAEALGKLYLDRNLIKKLGEGARKKAEENYDWNRLGSRLKKIYEEVL